ncbi:helix-turn-helix domain-containing protein [Streptomyces sp. SID8379]|uniref:helix-turn-helix domain-containing protein n=1 Tax=unclassified Streptomyces TaxID=2593676 RepID=UPI00037A54AD|nr:helix-turn-helix domain-containing protein [Streptomyces sp. HmicA12]MYW63125.1 helix-turn-helix domain-containing protein [Streptomyces sp. SID8379]
MQVPAGRRPGAATSAPVTHAVPDEPVIAGSMVQVAAHRTVRPGGTADWLLMATVEGRARLRLPDAPDVLVGPRQVTVIEPRTPHDYGPDEESGSWSLRWAHMLPRPEWLPLLQWPSVAPGVRRIDVDETVHARIVRALDRAILARRGGLRHETLFAMNALEEALLWCDSANPREPVLDPRLLAVLEHVAARLQERHTVASLARVAGLSASRLAHLAAEQLGTSLMAYVERRRMDVARRLLTHTDLPIAQVAVQAGFADPLYFSRRFRAASSRTPSEFRATATATDASSSPPAG